MKELSTGQPLPNPHVSRGGLYYRLGDPDWIDPLDGTYSKERGGRWNPPNSFAVVYLNASEETARANVRRRFEPQPFSPDDLLDDRLPELVDSIVPADDVVDVLSDEGCLSIGLPVSYPLDKRGREIPPETCQTKGQSLFDLGEAGIACRSAATPKPPYGEELAWFQRDSKLAASRRRSFREWFFRSPLLDHLEAGDPPREVP